MTESAIGKEARDILAIRDAVAVSEKKKPTDVTADEIMKSPQGVALGLDPKNQGDPRIVDTVLKSDESSLPDTKSTQEYSEVKDPNDPRIAQLSTEVMQDPMHPLQPNAEPIQTLGAGLVGATENPLELIRVHFTETRTAQPPGPKAPLAGSTSTKRTTSARP